MKLFALILVLAVTQSTWSLPTTSYQRSVDKLGASLSKLWNAGNFELFGAQCEYTTSPTIRRFELNYKAYVTCPDLGGLEARDQRLSSSGALEHAIRNLLKQAVENDVLTQEQADSWV